MDAFAPPELAAVALVRRAALVGRGALVGLAAGLCSCGSGHAVSHVSPATVTAAAPSAVYATKWEPAYTLNRSGRRIQSISRSARSETLEIVDRTCYPRDARFVDASRRLARTKVIEQPAAVIITVFMHPEPPPRTPCVPAGIGFAKKITLPHPLGARALVDGGNPKLGGGVIAVIRVAATNRGLERRAEARFGPPDLAPIP